jgi:hypothetical protein
MKNQSKIVSIKKIKKSDLLFGETITSVFSEKEMLLPDLSF